MGIERGGPLRLWPWSATDKFCRISRPDAITLLVTIVGERIEIDIFEDDHREISRFRGDESIEGGEELLAQILKDQD